MTITEFVFLSADQALDLEGADAVKNAVAILKRQKGLEHLVIGKRVEEPVKVLAIVDWSALEDHINFTKSSPERADFNAAMMSTFERQNNFHANLDRSPFGTGAPLSSNVTEFTQLFFPASKVTPEFVKEFERSWQSFQTIMQEGVKGLHEIVKGWVLEEQEHESVQGEKATCFFALVGWDSLEHHQRAQQSEAFAKAAPLVVSLASGYDIWHVQHKSFE